jgi:hypothetical protein
MAAVVAAVVAVVLVTVVVLAFYSSLILYAITISQNAAVAMYVVWSQLGSGVKA